MTKSKTQAKKKAHREMRPSVRFDVFKRDAFTCSYCGRRPPTVVLEVDHITPVAGGGTNDIDNLTTACWDCNHGKGCTDLGDKVKPRVALEHSDELRERALQAQAYAEALQEQRTAESRMLDLINERWAQAFGATVTETGWRLGSGDPPFPIETTIRRFLKIIPLDEILDAIDITAASRCSRRQADRYFYGTCWKKIRGEDR